MKSNDSYFFRLWARITRTIDRTPAPEKDKLRIRYFLVFVLVGAATMILYGLYNLYAGHYLLCVLIAVSATGLVTGFVVLLHLKNGEIVYRLNGLFFLALLVYALAVGGEDGSMILWSYTFPLITLFLLGEREGLIWAGVLLSVAMVCFWVPLPFGEIYPYSGQFIVRFLSTYLIICMVTFWFEHFRASYRRNLETEHQRFSDILEHSREILYRRDLQSGRYLYISKAFSDLLGYSRAELESSNYRMIEELIHPDDLDPHNALLRNIVAPHATDTNGQVVEYRMRRKDGDYLWFSDQIAVICDASGQPDSVIGCNREITQQRQMKKALEKTSDQLRTILDSIDAHIYVADMQSYRILFMNSKMSTDFGRNMEGGICWKNFREADGPCDHCSNALLLDENNRPTGVHEWESFNPVTKRWYNNYDRAIHWIDGKWVRIQIAVDISRIKEMEKERQRHQEILRRARHFEAIGTLAGGIAHDFNNLLQIILGNISLLEYDLHPDSDSRHNVQEIKKASYKAKELADRLITFSTGGVPNTAAVTIVRLLRDAADELTAETTITCELVIVEDLWLTPIDYGQISAAVKSVIKNACESTNHAGRIDILAENYTHVTAHGNNDQLTPGGKYVKVRIQDDGCGIPEADLSKIFEPYFSTKQKGQEKGLGLSLSIAHSIVRQHHGHITVSSQQDCGTIVDIYLQTQMKTQTQGRQPGGSDS